MTEPTRIDPPNRVAPSGEIAEEAASAVDASVRARPPIRGMPTGVAGLDAVLGGGLPEHSFNLIAGAPGTGKTTLALQILFANATAGRPALYFTMVGEPTVKLLRYQQQFDFFQPDLLGSTVHVRNLSGEVLDGDFDAVLERITTEVERMQPGVVVIDSFRWIAAGDAGRASRASARTWRADPSAPNAMGLEEFIQRLALQLTTWEVTAFLLGEYGDADLRHPLFTVADGILWLTQAEDRNSVVRKLQVTKLRGRAPMPGLHTFRMTGAGVQVFPRIPEQQWHRTPGRPRDATRLSTGVPGLDALMGGGIPAGDAVLIAGPTGSGKTTVGMQFVADGLRRDEACVVAVFEEYPEDYLARLTTLGVDAAAHVRAGTLAVTYLRPLDLSVDETLSEILDAVRRSGARRVVIDSLSGFEVALAPTFREDFRESLYRLVGALTATAVTVLMTQEAVGTAPAAGFTGERVSFITDDIIVQRYVEIAGALRKVLAVAKMRRSEHSEQLWAYRLTPGGAVVGEPLTEYDVARSVSPATPARVAGLTERETRVLDALARLGEGTPDAVAAQVLAPAEEVAHALERLVALGYVAALPASGAGAVRAYRPVVRPSTP